MTGSVSAFYSKGANNENYDHASVALLLYGTVPLLAFQRDIFFSFSGILLLLSINSKKTYNKEIGVLSTETRTS